MSTENEGAAATPPPTPTPAAGRGDDDTAVLRPVTDSPPPEETRTTGLRRVPDPAPAGDDAEAARGAAGAARHEGGGDSAAGSAAGRPASGAVAAPAPAEPSSAASAGAPEPAPAPGTEAGGSPAAPAPARGSASAPAGAQDAPAGAAEAPAAPASGTGTGADDSPAAPVQTEPGSAASADAPARESVSAPAGAQDASADPRAAGAEAEAGGPSLRKDGTAAEPSTGLRRVEEEPSAPAASGPYAAATPAPPAAYAQDSGGGAGPQPPYSGSSSGSGSGQWGGGQGDGGAPPPPPPGGGGPHTPWGVPPMPPGPPGGGKGGRSRFGLLVVAAVVAALVAGVVGGGIGFWAANSGDGSSTTVSSDTGSEALNRSPDSVAGIAAEALPSVVTIHFRGDSEAGTGTGFVFDKEGHILTNNHVVAAAADGGKLTATFSDGKQYDAKIVGRAQGYDVAVIKLEDPGGHELNPLPLGNSDKVRVGDAAIAIGAPYGLSGTVTTGIISAKDRPVASSDGQGSDASYMNALQTDASINPGNSGGPLLNAKGEVIGINSAIQSGGGGLGGGQPGSIGLGFAIPINQAQRVAQQLIKTGVPVYPVIGVRVSMGTDTPGDGAVIARRVNEGEPVTPGGPADKAGLQPGDRIVKFDGTKIDSGPTLIATIWAHQPGDTVPLTYVRDGEKHTTQITLGSRKGES